MTSYCTHYSHPVRNALHGDPELGIGNFLFKVLAKDVPRASTLFSLDRPFRSPRGKAYAALSLGDLETVVGEVAAWYQHKGIRAGHIVCTYTSEGISQFLHFLALTSLRAIPAPVNWRMKPDIALLYHRKYRFDFFVFDDHDHTDAVAALGASDPRLLRYDEVGPSLSPRPAGGWPARYGAADETVMICHSSGTTGVPKAVLFGHQQFFVGKRRRLLEFLETDTEKMLSALPHSHSAGISYLMTAVLLGMPTLVLSDLTGPSLSDQIARFQPTVIAAFSQTYSALAATSPRPGSLSVLRRFYNTGDTAHESHIRALIEAAPDARFIDGFGASELGMALFGKVSTKGRIASGRCVGLPVPFASVKIIDELERPLPPRAIGYVAIKSDSITPGYYQDEALTLRCRTSDGYWMTGDLGYLDERGAFFHLDRAVDVIQTAHGAAYTLALEEEVLQHCPVADVTLTGVTLTPRTSQLVTAFVQVPVAQAPDICARVIDVLDATLRRNLKSSVPLCVVNWAPGYRPPLGATGKALKRLIRDSFWTQYQDYVDTDSVFSHVVFRHFQGVRDGAGGDTQRARVVTAARNDSSLTKLA